jgi:predicted O-methyltransferase YrrM
MELEHFADPWEHVRMWSDERRCRALVRLLETRAAGRRVLEVGTGPGIFACLAARLGATGVVALEPTSMAEVARRLVHENQLQDRVEIVQAPIEQASPRPSDLVFTDLFNADPFFEDLPEVMLHARPWLAPGGMLAPRRLKVWVAAADDDSVREARDARGLVDELAARHGLGIQTLEPLLAPRESYVHLAPQAPTCGPPALAFDLRLGTDPAPEHARVRVPVSERDALGGVAVWFEAELDDGLHLGNAPGASGHFGILRCGWGQPVQVPDDGHVPVDVWVQDGSLSVTPGS